MESRHFILLRRKPGAQYSRWAVAWCQLYSDTLKTYTSPPPPGLPTGVLKFSHNVTWPQCRREESSLPSLPSCLRWVTSTLGGPPLCGHGLGFSSESPCPARTTSIAQMQLEMFASEHVSTFHRDLEEDGPWPRLGARVTLPIPTALPGGRVREHTGPPPAPLVLRKGAELLDAGLSLWSAPSCQARRRGFPPLSCPRGPSSCRTVAAALKTPSSVCPLPAHPAAAGDVPQPVRCAPRGPAEAGSVVFRSDVTDRIPLGRWTSRWRP